MRNTTLHLLFLCIGLASLCGCAGLAPVSQNLPQPGGLEGLAQLRDGRTMRSSSCHEEWRDTNVDAIPIEPGETLTIADLEGPGVITHLWNTYVPGELAAPSLLVIRMYWDGEEQPSVEAPLGDFFAVGHGLNRDVDSAVVGNSSHGRARNCYWPMPFVKSARITITNEGRSRVGGFFFYVDWEKRSSLPRDTAYFHAQYRQAFPALDAANYVIAEIEGCGHYVGTVYSVREWGPGWWGEGDDFFFVDGEEEPSLQGTGSEDYFCDAWGLRLLSQPYYGAPVYDGLGVPRARTTAYRWHIPDPVRFRESLRVEIEHKGAYYEENGELVSHFKARPDYISSVAFWYQAEPHAPFPPLPPADERIHHDPEDVQETEARADAIEHRAGRLEPQYGPWSGGVQMMWVPEVPEGVSLVLPFEVPEDGLYRLTLYHTLSQDYGDFELLLNENPLDRILQGYAASFHTVGTPLGEFPLVAGEQSLAFRHAGRDPRSVGYLLGLDCLLVERVEHAGANSEE